MIDELPALELDLSMASMTAIELFLDQSEDEDFYRELFEACKGRPEAVALIAHHERTPQEVKELAARVLNMPVPLKDVTPKPVNEEEKQQSLMKQISQLGISEKIRLGQKGGSQARSILSKESNKLVVMAVLANPKITDSEIEAMAKNRSLIDDALRRIGKTKEWMKNYNIKLALLTNPKTPIGISMPFVMSLKKKDLGLLEKNKNVPEGLRTLAKKAIKGTKD